MPTGSSETKQAMKPGATTMYTLTTTQQDKEYTDQELLNMVSYFEVSRAELKSVSANALILARIIQLIAFSLAR